MNRRRPARKLTLSTVEALDGRVVPSGLGPDIPADEAIVTTRGGQTLGSIYREYVSYEQSGGKGTFSPAEADLVHFDGTSVGVDIRLGGDFSKIVGELKGIGMHVTATVPKLGIVEGYLPISELPTVARDSHETSLSPSYKPATNPAAVAAQQVATVSQKGGQALGSIYQEYLAYEQSGGKGDFSPTEADRIYFDGTSVGVDVRFGGDFNTLLGQLKGIGMHVTATVPKLGIVEGYLPLSVLPNVAGNSHLAGLSPVYKPATNVPTAQQVANISQKGGPVLASIYQEYLAYEQSGGKGTFSPAEADQVDFKGTSVGVVVHFGSGDFKTLLGQLKGIGTQVTGTDPEHGLVLGYLPVSELPIVASNSHLADLSPEPRAMPL